MPATSPRRVGVSGSYGGFNLGDEAILHVIISELRRARPVEITVFSRDAEDTLRRHRVDRTVDPRRLPRREVLEIIRGLDLFILGGGGILYDGDADMYLREVVMAHEVGTPVMVHGISAGPLVDRERRERVRAALDRAVAITVRDANTRQLLEEIGVQREITLTADPALLLAPEPLTLEEILRAEAIDPEARLVGFSVREPGPAAPHLDVEHYHRLIANTADFIVDRLDAEIVFVPMERRSFDVQHSHGVVGQMGNAQRATVLKCDYTPGQLLSILGHFQFTVGMRLHFLMFSALADVPFVGLPYAAKVAGFLEGLGLPSPSLEHVSAGQLVAQIDRAWDFRGARQDAVRRALGPLQDRARKNNEIAVRLLDGAARGRAVADVGT